MKVTAAFRETYQFLFHRNSSNLELPDNPKDLLCHFGTTAVSCLNRGAVYETTEGEKLPMRTAEQLVCKLINAKIPSCRLCSETATYTEWGS